MSPHVAGRTLQEELSKGPWGEDDPGFPRGPVSSQGPHKEGGGRCHLLSVRMEEGARDVVPPEAGKGGTDSPLEPLEGPDLPAPSFSPTGLFWTYLQNLE